MEQESKTTKTFNIFKENGKIIVQGRKGDKGDSPTKDELLEIIEPLIPEKGEDGKDYILTERDKKEIAKTIVVPKQEAPIVNVPPANITVTPTPVEFPSEMKVIGMDKLIAEVSRETEEKSIFEEVSSKRPLAVMIMDNKGNPILDFGSDITAPSVVGIKVGTTAVDENNPLPVTVDGFAIPMFDEQVIDEALAPATTVITYKRGGTTVATKTIIVSGTTTTITVT